MLQIKNQYKGVSVEYLLGNVRVTKKIEQLTEKDIETAKKWGLNLGKYFDEVTKKTEETIEPFVIEFNGVEIERIMETYPKPKRKKK
jgi:hypothetical protein